MEHEDDIRRHSFIGNNDLLTAIDDEVAALIKHALFRVLGNITVVHVFEVAKVGADHDWRLPHEHLD